MAVVNCIVEHNAMSWTIVQSFHFRYLEAVHQLAPGLECHKLVISHFHICGVPVHLDLDGIHIGQRYALSSLPSQGIASLNVMHRFATAALVNQLHALNLKIFVYTVDDDNAITKALNNGVDGVISNDPLAAIRLASNMHRGVAWQQVEEG
eukprot:gnl/TRDRNA2_/TRDRNA2_146614_c0_seq1.p1 gnl/TRDRNA2_/TRDRNA2_146614_c0~~gnl/TRDRNA2_/TRDRNA2_146614_c0_seq1.p1  ORF type:complete len:177 (+),score=16.13 gnl/TRDRNA2_/TRDRNA2_146614_c0_seq1:81-533(+)